MRISMASSLLPACKASLNRSALQLLLPPPSHSSLIEVANGYSTAPQLSHQQRIESPVSLDKHETIVSHACQVTPQANSRSVMGGSNLHITNIVAHVIQSVGNHFPLGKRRQVQVVNLDSLLGIGVPLTIELTYQLFFFCVHAHNGITSIFVALHQCLNVLKLPIALPMVSCS